MGRFIFLVLTYALFRIRHYWPVAVSTAVSDAALVVKIFAVFPGLGVSDEHTFFLESFMNKFVLRILIA